METQIMSNLQKYRIHDVLKLTHQELDLKMKNLTQTWNSEGNGLELVDLESNSDNVNSNTK